MKLDQYGNEVSEELEKTFELLQQHRINKDNIPKSPFIDPDQPIAKTASENLMENVLFELRVLNQTIKTNTNTFQRLYSLLERKL